MNEENPKITQAQREFYKKLEKFSDDKVIIINDREYEMAGITHLLRVDVGAIYSVLEAQCIAGVYTFLSDEKYKEIADKINDKVLFKDSQISKIKDAHFEKHPEDFYEYVHLTMAVISYPFYKKKVTTLLQDL